MIQITGKESVLLSDFIGTFIGTTIDWNVLMGVVEKIESLTTEDGRGTVNYVVSLDRYYGVVSVGGEGEVAEYQGETWVETVLNLVLQFIQWFNTQNLIYGVFYRH